jgi:hypothetical protein
MQYAWEVRIEYTVLENMKGRDLGIDGKINRVGVCGLVSPGLG